MTRTTAAMLLLVLVIGVGASAVRANSFYTEGEAKPLEGAKNFARTVVDILLTIGLPLSAVGLFIAGLYKVASKEPGKGVAGIGSGVGTGYVSTLVNNLHSDATASVSLASLSPSLSWYWIAVNLVLQAGVCAFIYLYVWRNLRCGNRAAASSMPQ